MKYKVCFEGFAYVDADDYGDAMDKVDDGEVVYMEQEYLTVTEVDEFDIDI